MTGSRGVLGRTFQETQRDLEICSFPGDATKIEDFRAWHQENGPFQALVHFAALVPTQAVEENPIRAFETNVGGTLNLLETVRTTSGEKPWLFLASTSHVYPSRPEPQSEEAQTSAFSLYGLTKLQAEEWGRTYLSKHGLPICVGRIFSFSSPLQASSYFIPSMIRKISTVPQGGTLDIPGLEGTRDFLSTAQICEAIRLLMDREARGVFNIASGKPTRLIDVARKICELVDRQDVTIQTHGEAKHHLADVDKILSLGFKPKFDLEKLIREFRI